MKWLSEMWLRLTGWTFEGSVPDQPKLVIIGYPHTSNWDFFVLLAVVGHFDLDARFLAHQGLFVGPFGWRLRKWGAIPVQGDAAKVSAALVEAFDGADSLILIIAPEGTRAGGSAWKSGFWRIADAADVPVVMGFVDGKTKRTGFGPALKVEGDPDRWMEQARIFYADKQGLKVQNRGPLEFDR